MRQIDAVKGYPTAAMNEGAVRPIPMSPISNMDELRTRLTHGDREALAEVFAVHKKRLRRMVELLLDRRLYGRLDADDVLQEAYLDASERVEQYVDEHSGSLFVWLRLNVKQTLINVHRRHLGAERRDARRDVSIFNHHRMSTASFAWQLLGHVTSPSQSVIRHELVAKLDEALEAMSSVDREVLMLRHFEQLTNAEVAQVLGIEQKAASNRYTRALRRLRAVFSEITGLSGV